jgi:hypothetical protein
MTTYTEDIFTVQILYDVVYMRASLGNTTLQETIGNVSSPSTSKPWLFIEIGKQHGLPEVKTCDDHPHDI